MVLLGAFNEGCLYCKGACQKALPHASGSVVSWESSGSLSQLKWEECAGERGLQSTAPAHGRGRKMLYSGLSREAARGLCSSPMTRCPVAASSSWLRQPAEGGREAGSLGPSQAGLAWLELGSVQGKESFTYRKPGSRISWLR